MADTEVMTNEVETKTEAAKKPAKEQNLWAVKKKIRLDKSLGGDKKSVYVAVNGRAYNVPTGKEWEVPQPIYEQLKRMEVQMDMLDDVRDDIAKEAKENMSRNVG
jgi:hypothetical protein